MNDEYGNIELSREQFRELLMTLVVGMHIRRHADELRSAENPLEAENDDLAAAEELEHYLLSLAPGFEAEDLVERSEDNLIPSKVTEEFCHAIIDEHDNERFWDRLETELAERDFLQTLPEAERAIVEETHMFPKGVEPYYEKYRKEFDDNGTDNLMLKEKE